ncbi:hypothetical protein MMRN_38640 [Mycobacterium marinum]|nr:hypothetical protein CCUG20998_03558 [Mycobacterium marinum]RFZ25443.1 hypothetical protein DSM43519_01629 [Mycobacterium marinum]RFZ28329.1 hypothetical protein DSM44344_01374 [Mycobacterium marinum]BBC66968.1 hypothetical protein MMRN_38640 [Mycobacterium marinum]
MIISPTPAGAEYDDIVLRMTSAGGVSVAIEPDPLGDINCIIRLLHNGRQVRGVLHPKIKPGTEIRVARDDSTVSIREMFATMDNISVPREVGKAIEITNFHPPGWRVVVDGKTVLRALDSELYPDSPVPKIPWRRRTCRATNTRIRAVADALAMRLGYHRDGECEGDDW